MMVHGHLFVVILGEEIVPKLWDVLERIVEDEVGLWRVLLNHLSHFSVEVFQNVNWDAIVGLVNRLKTIERWVSSPSLKECFSDVKRKSQVLIIDIVSSSLFEPVPGVVLLEMVIVLPDDFSCSPTIVETILRIHGGVNIKHNFNI